MHAGFEEPVKPKERVIKPVFSTLTKAYRTKLREKALIVGPSCLLRLILGSLTIQILLFRKI